MHAHCVQALRLLLRLSMDTMRPCCGHHACAKPPSRWCRIKSADSCSNKLPSAACLAAWAIEDTDRRPNMPCSEGVCTHCGLVRTTRRTLCGGRIRCASTTALSISIAHVCGVQPRSISACSNALSCTPVPHHSQRPPEWHSACHSTTGGGAGWRVGAHGCTGYHTRSVVRRPEHLNHAQHTRRVLTRRSMCSRLSMARSKLN